MQGFIARTIPMVLRRLVTMVPALVVLAIGVNPTEALVLSQVVLSFGIPFALIPLLLLTRRRDIMGGLVNRRITTVAASIAAALIIALNLFLLARTILCPKFPGHGDGRHLLRAAASRSRTTGPTSSWTCGSPTRSATSRRRRTWCRPTPSRTRTTTGTGGSSWRTASATPPPPPSSTARCARWTRRGSTASSPCGRRGRPRRGHADVGPSAVRAGRVPPHPLPVAPTRC